MNEVPQQWVTLTRLFLSGKSRSRVKRFFRKFGIRHRINVSCKNMKTHGGMYGGRSQ